MHPVARKAFKHQPSASQGCPCQHIWKKHSRCAPAGKKLTPKGLPAHSREHNRDLVAVVHWGKAKTRQQGLCMQLPTHQAPQFLETALF